jgi:hypothetical protein
MRRVFTRRDRPIPLIGRDGRLYKVTPRDHAIVPARFVDFGRWGHYRSEAAATPAPNWAQNDPRALDGLDLQADKAQAAD